jgi:hypothetical protein
MTAERRIVKAKKAVIEGIIPLGYSTVFRLASDPHWKNCFLYLGGSLCVDLDKFFELGEEEAQKRALMK